MHVDVISDLHLEFADMCLPGGDVLILSGDIFEAKNFNEKDYNPEMVTLPFEPSNKRPDRYYRFLLEECSQKYRHVIWVMGNHEHYSFTFNKTYDHIKSQLPDNVYLLEKESIELDGVLFLGATLWTDMNGGDDLTMFHLKSCMNDFRIIRYQNEQNDYYRFQPEIAYRHHQDTLAFFRIALENNRARTEPRPVVVVTHHAPSKLSIKPKYAGDHLMNGGYSSDLSEFMLDHPEIRVWTHGHTHDEFRYQVGETTVLCNPRGYAGYEERAVDYTVKGFDIDHDGVITFDPAWEE
jgi:predicted phosphodiesterase